MGSISWMKEIPSGTALWDSLARPSGDRFVVITLEVFGEIGDYSRSMPTGPSPGRVYRKNMHWSGPPSNWFIYVCKADPDEEGYTLHHPYKPILVDTDLDILLMGEGRDFPLDKRGRESARV